MRIAIMMIAAAIAVCTVSPSFAREPLPLAFPLADFPFNTEDGYSFPSMGQSLNLCKITAQVSHSIVFDSVSAADIPLGRYVPYLLTAVFDYFYFYLPPGYAWVHEEWHRAVMTRRGIRSFNDVYNFDFFAESIAVSHVTDDDLVMLKRNHPAETVRLSAAGYEADIELVLAMRRDSFFYERPLRYDLISWWMNLLNSAAYIDLCTSSEADRLTDEANREDGADVSRRDFTGLDFTAWVYDLFRPDEPYEARGVHPSGIGIDRYIRNSDLTDEEKRYLKLQRNLSLLNFISPQMFGIERFSLSNPISGQRLLFNFAVTHHLTCFGYDVSLHAFFREGDVNASFTYHHYSNDEGAFPGIESSLTRVPLALGSVRAFAGVTGALWLQPRGLGFRDGERKPGGLARASLSFPLAERMEIFFQGEVKSEGWVAGIVYLESAAQFQAGIVLLW